MELEMKFKVEQDYEANLLKLGYVPSSLHHQADIYFLNGEKIKGVKTWLRLREDKLNKTYSIGFHRMETDFMAEETEIPLSSIDQVCQMQMILETIGYPVQCIVHKKRRAYHRGDFEVVLDEIEDLGSFLEVELIAEGTDKNIQRLKEAVQELGLKSEQAINTGYPNLLIAVNKKASS